MFSQKTTKHLNRMILFCCFACLTPALQSQVRDFRPEKKADIAATESSFTCTNQRLVFPTLKRESNQWKHRAFFPISTTNNTHRKVAVDLCPYVRDQKMDAIVRRFSVLMEDELTTVQDPGDRMHSLFSKKILLGTDHHSFAGKTLWKAHLQREQFEMMADKLSLNDINRFQFRQNRSDGDLLPIKPVGGETVPEYLEK